MEKWKKILKYPLIWLFALFIFGFALWDNLKYMEEFLDKYPDLPVTFSVIPNAYTVLTEKLPAGFAAVSVDQNQRIGELYSRLEGKSSHLKLLELSPVLLEHQEEYIYYRTDHHWTTYGAYLAYGEYVRSLGLEPVPWGELAGWRSTSSRWTFSTTSAALRCGISTPV